MLNLDTTATFALATLVLFLGQQLQQRIGFCQRYNLPAPVLGGLVVAICVLIAKQQGWQTPQFDTSGRTPLMIAFFTSIGFGASVQLLKQGGRLVALFFAIAVVAAILQNLVGAGVALLLHEPPLFGVLVGSVTLTGGPATGLAFAPQFEAAGIQGAQAIAVAAAMCGIISGGLMGSPLATVLIERFKAFPNNDQAHGHHLSDDEDPRVNEDSLIKSIGLFWLAMWLGGWVSQGISATGITLPAYIGAMLIAAILRNIDDVTGWFKLSKPILDVLGNVSLSYFLALSLMTLELWKLSTVALPLLVIIVAQIALVAVCCLTLVFPVMGRNYQAAVMSSGFCGFMMGTTANAMANMDALCRRYGPAPTAFLVVPMVGAFFIDFANTLLVQACLQWWK